MEKVLISGITGQKEFASKSLLYVGIILNKDQK